MNSRPRTATLVASAVLAFFMVFVLSFGAVATTVPAPAAGTPQTVWAYGSVRTASVGPLHTSDGWEYEGNYIIGYAVILNETDLNSTAFELTVHRTMGASFTIEFCKPNCVTPLSFAYLTARAWESVNSSANFTTQGVVEETQGSVPAIALVNASSSVHANVTESVRSALPSSGTIVDRSSYLSAAVSSLASVRFSPSLGLLPLNVIPGMIWQSSSAFNASGSSHYSYYYTAHGPLRNVTIGPNSGGRTVTPSGNVSVEGAYGPSSVVSFGGVSYPAISLTITGPFSVREGVILIPEAADLFGSSSQPWAANQSSSTTVNMASLDVKPVVNGHFGLVASSWTYASSSANPAEVVEPASGVSDVVGATDPVMNPVGSYTIQGAPETVSQAQAASNCLTSGLGCPSTAPVTRALLAAIGVAVVVAGVAGLIAVVQISDRRRLPPPVYPNANLYPPAAARSPSTSAARPPQTPPAPAEEDPLDHLW